MIYSAEEIETYQALMDLRFSAASVSEKSYADAARREHRKSVEWIASESTDKGSFRWICDLLELEPDAVRRALKAAQR